MHIISWSKIHKCFLFYQNFFLHFFFLFPFCKCKVCLYLTGNYLICWGFKWSASNPAEYQISFPHLIPHQVSAGVWSAKVNEAAGVAQQAGRSLPSACPWAWTRSWWLGTGPGGLAGSAGSQQHSSSRRGSISVACLVRDTHPFGKPCWVLSIWYC